MNFLSCTRNESVKYPLNFYTFQVHVSTNDGFTPYALSLKWRHLDDVAWTILRLDPSIDWRRYARIRYGTCLSYCFGTCLVDKIHQVEEVNYQEYGSDSESQSQFSHSVASEGVNERNKVLRTTLSGVSGFSEELGMEGEGDENVSAGDGEQCRPGRKISVDSAIMIDNG